MQMILGAVQAFTDWLWGIPMLIFIIGGGFYLSVRLGFLQFTKLGFILKNTIGKAFGQKTEQGKFSSFQAVSGALASTLGAGNIIGTAMAIAYGGPGGVFWLWLSGLVCCCVKYSEVTLAMKYRRLNEKGQWEGGPQIYLERASGKKWTSISYAVIAVCCLFLAAAGQIGSGVDNLGTVGGLLVTVAVVLFTFTTACAQIEFCTAHVARLFGENKRTICRWIMLALLFMGGIVGIDALIAYVDFFSGLYTIINMAVVYLCASQIVALTRECFADTKKWESEKWPEWKALEKEYQSKHQ